MLNVALLFLIISAFGFWFVQFADLMRRSDDEFPGRFDKLIWGLAMIFASVFGALVYFFCKPAVPTYIVPLHGELVEAGKKQSVDKPDIIA